MAAIGSVWATNSWVSAGGWAANTWDTISATALTRLDDDTTTALTFALRSINSSLWMNERIRAHLNTAYGTTNTDIQPLFARALKDIKE